MFTRVSGTGVVGIAGCNDALHIPWLFLEGLSDPAVSSMSVTKFVDLYMQSHFITLYQIKLIITILIHTRPSLGAIDQTFRL